MDWGTVKGDVEDGATDFVEPVTCAGIASIAGTGPFRYVDQETGDNIVNRVIFDGFADYWGGAPDIERLEIVRYATSAEVKEALLSGELDLVWGAGVLSDADIVEIQQDAVLSENIGVGLTGDLQNVILLLNTGAPPFDDINVRKTVIHAINKAAIVEKELNGLQTVVDNVFPLEAPYCDVELTPRWDYDFEKAALLSCDGTAGQFSVDQDDDNNKALALGLGIGLGVFAISLFFIAVSLYNKNKNLQQELDLTKKDNAVDA